MKAGVELSGQDLAFRYRGAARDAVGGVSVDIPSGALVAILGPNGSGKTTLLRLLVGGETPTHGVVSIGGRSLTEWDRRELARQLAVVPQAEHMAFPVTVEQLVAMGRYPHLGPWRAAGDRDIEAMEAAMNRCGVLDLRDRLYQSLSGGERQRVRIARALAQEPSVLVLDEPTAALDMRFEMAVFRLLRKLRSEDGVTVVLVTHNVNLAARFADRVILMKDGRVAVDGAPADVITPDHIEGVFGWPVSVTQQPFEGGSAPQLFPD
ncbi:MAG: ABC transporter ATP-binding protein [Longimicrobiales bacterium]